MSELTTHEQVFHALTRWSGDLDEARSLVACARDLPNVPGKDVSDAVLVLRVWLKKDTPVPERRHYPAAAAWVAGQPSSTPWPWRTDDGVHRLALDLDTPFEPGTKVPEDVQRAVTRAQDAIHAMGHVVEDPEKRAFEGLCGLLRYRPRPVWTAAVLALSRYGASSPEKLAAVAEFHASLDNPRHALVLALAMDVRGAPLPGAKLTLRDDPSDASAVLSVLAALAADAAHLDRVAIHVRATLAVAKRQRSEASYQLWEALRDLADAFPSAMDDDAWNLLLDEAIDHGSHAGTRTGALIDAGRTAEWLQGTQRWEQLERLAAERLRSAPGLARIAIAVTTRQRIDALTDAVLDRITVLRGVEWNTTAPAERDVKVAELVWLLRHAETSTWRWNDLIRRGGVPELALDSDELTVSEAAGPALLNLLVPRKASWMELEHIDPTRHAEKLVATAVRARWSRSEPNIKFTQLASVMILRRLMQARTSDQGSPEPELAEFLLQVFVADRTFEVPYPTETKKGKSNDPSLWLNVAKYLPDPTSRAARIASRLHAVDDANRTAPFTDAGARALNAATRWIDAVREVCHLPAGETAAKNRSERFEKFAAMVAGAVALRTTDAWRACDVKHLEPFAEALAEWLVNDDKEARELRAAAAKLADRLKVAGSDARITTAERSEIEAALAHLRHSVADQDLPVRSIIGSLEADIVTWARQQEAKTRASEEDRLRLRRMLEECDESELELTTAALCGAPANDGTNDDAKSTEAAELRERLGDALIGDLGRFWLRRLRFDLAQRLRENVRDGQGTFLVPSRSAHYSPLVVGICGGPLATLQLSSLTNAVMTHGASYYVPTVTLAIVIACALLWGELRRHATNVPFRELARRAFGPFLTILGIACMVSAAFVLLSDVVTSKSIHDWGWKEIPYTVGTWHVYPQALLANVLLWGSLSLFQGVFLGLIAQGRGMDEG